MSLGRGVDANVLQLVGRKPGTSVCGEQWKVGVKSEAGIHWGIGSGSIFASWQVVRIKNLPLGTAGVGFSSWKSLSTLQRKLRGPCYITQLNTSKALHDL